MGREHRVEPGKLVHQLQNPGVPLPCPSCNACCVPVPAALQVGQQPLELLNLRTLRDFLLFEFCAHGSEEHAQQQGRAVEQRPEQPAAAGEDCSTGEQPSVQARAQQSATAANSSSEAVASCCDFERIVDDVVFISFLAGTDFAPHVPSVEIYDRPKSGMEALFDKYKVLTRTKKPSF